jgi:hypothetical protein
MRDELGTANYGRRRQRDQPDQKLTQARTAGKRTSDETEHGKLPSREGRTPNVQGRISKHERGIPPGRTGSSSAMEGIGGANLGGIFRRAGRPFLSIRPVKPGKL